MTTLYGVLTTIDQWGRMEIALIDCKNTGTRLQQLEKQYEQKGGYSPVKVDSFMVKPTKKSIYMDKFGKIIKLDQLVGRPVRLEVDAQQYTYAEKTGWVLRLHSAKEIIKLN